MPTGVPVPSAVSACRTRTIPSSLCSVFFRHERHTSSLLDTVHWASAAAICWMSSTVLTRRETKSSVMFLRIWACSCHLGSSSADEAGACSCCGQ